MPIRSVKLRPESLGQKSCGFGEVQISHDHCYFTIRRMCDAGAVRRNYRAG
jgi:hypothetical protein